VDACDQSDCSSGEWRREWQPLDEDRSPFAEAAAAHSEQHFDAGADQAGGSRFENELRCEVRTRGANSAT